MNENLTTEQMQNVWDEVAAGNDAPIEPAPEQESTPAPEQPPEAVQAEDPFATLPEAVRRKLYEIDEIREHNARLEHELRSAAGRVAAMQREHDKARAVQQHQPTQQQVSAAVKNPERWESLKSDFPEWGEAMEEYVNARLQGMQPGQGVSPEQIADFVNSQVSNSKAELARAIEEAKIEGRHESWREEVQTQEFGAWLSAQAPEVQRLAESERSRDAIRMLDMYAEAKKSTATGIKQERNARLSVAATQRGSAPPPKSVDDMSAAELWEHEAKKRSKTLRDRGF